MGSTPIFLLLSLLFVLNNLMLFCDYPLSYSMGFQDPGSHWMYPIIELHDRIIYYSIIIFILVIFLMYRGLTNPLYLPNLLHGNTIELIWTILPAIILWLIGIPSLHLLYNMDENLDADLTIKILGTQWYWSYEYTDYNDIIQFDSFLIDLPSLQLGDHRQLTVDNNLILPILTNIRMIITSNDVIHSFAIPSLAIKLDALPGRLNSVGLLINRPSLYYGLCSELCGSLHGFMPIALQAVSLPTYLSFITCSQLKLVV